MNDIIITICLVALLGSALGWLVGGRVADSMIARGRRRLEYQAPRRNLGAMLQPPERHQFARTILIDYVEKQIHIDGILIPWYIDSDGPTIEQVAPNSRYSLVNLPIYTENVMMLRPLSDDLLEIRELGKSALEEDTAALRQRWSKELQASRHRHSQHMMEMRVEKRRRDGTLLQGDAPYDRPRGRDELALEVEVAARERGAQNIHRGTDIVDWIKGGR